MLLTIDAGNTNTVFGLYAAEMKPGAQAGEGLVEHWRLKTDAERTADEYAVMIRSFLDTVGYDMDEEVTGVAVCSGVPRVLSNLRLMIARYFEFAPVVIEPGVKTGMPILYDNPREVGADRIANSVAAYDLFGGPTIVVDFGTGTNFDIISAQRGVSRWRHRSRYRNLYGRAVRSCGSIAGCGAGRTAQRNRQEHRRVAAVRHPLRVYLADRWHGATFSGRAGRRRTRCVDRRLIARHRRLFRDHRARRAVPDAARVAADPPQEPGHMTQPYRYETTHTIGSIVELHGAIADGSETGVVVTVAGRLMLRRDQGKMLFGVLQDATGRMQLFTSVNWTADFDALRHASLGDWIGATGEIMKTKKGELSVKVASWTLLAEAQRTFPDKWHGISDVDMRFRQRYVDLWVTDEVAPRARPIGRASCRSRGAGSKTGALWKSRRRSFIRSPAGRSPGRSSRTTTRSICSCSCASLPSSTSSG